MCDTSSISKCQMVPSTAESSYCSLVSSLPFPRLFPQHGTHAETAAVSGRLHWAVYKMALGSQRYPHPHPLPVKQRSWHLHWESNNIYKKLSERVCLLLYYIAINNQSSPILIWRCLKKNAGENQSLETILTVLTDACVYTVCMCTVCVCLYVC